MEKKQELDKIEDKGIGNKFNRWRKQRTINKIEDNIDNAEHDEISRKIELLHNEVSKFQHEYREKFKQKI